MTSSKCRIRTLSTGIVIEATLKVIAHHLLHIVASELALQVCHRLLLLIRCLLWCCFWVVNFALEDFKVLVVDGVVCEGGRVVLA